MQAFDWLVLAAYSSLLLFLGWRASRGDRTAESHLRANRSLPAWAVVFSILATEVSAATYIGVPEAAYNGNWTYLEFAVGNLLGKWFLSRRVIPRYWRLQLPTVYGFLGQRIGPRTQRAAASAFLCGRLIASGVRLFIAAYAFAVVTGFELRSAILVMALLSTAYTFVGGLKAVVWTDVAQGSIFFIGAATALAVGLAQIGLPLGELVREASQAGKFDLVAFDKPLLRDAYNPIAAVLGGFFLVLATHGTDQENVQHMLSTRSAGGSSRSILASGFLTFPIVALFLAVGTMLWVYHRHVAVAYSLATPADVHRIFPNFIMHQLPTGVRGLVFAGLFAAAVSSLGATLNATTSAWTSDIFPPRAGTSARLSTVRGLICAFGVALALVALFFAWFTAGTESDLVQIALSAMTILYGGILGTFLVALFLERRGSDLSLLLGMLAGVGVGALLYFGQQPLLGRTALAWPWYLPLSAGTTVLVALTGRRAPPRP
ncbi:MAG: hypothetical protein IPJ19_11325 [Planctomycetes bacterium]|nr:hypothetical protein [Planctomycetota bacterium]